MNVAIRPAQISDLPAILAIYNDAVLHTTATYDNEPSTLEQRAQWYGERTRQGFPVLAAEHDGPVIGFGTYGTYKPRHGYRYTAEHSVYVAPEWRGQGVGRALLAELIQAARRQGLHALIGTIDAANTASIGLHSSLGFVQAAHLHEVGHKFGRWLDIVLLELLLVEYLEKHATIRA